MGEAAIMTFWEFISISTVLLYANCCNVKRSCITVYNGFTIILKGSLKINHYPYNS